jgi:hypothetical protein
MRHAGEVDAPPEAADILHVLDRRSGANGCQGEAKSMSEEEVEPFIKLCLQGKVLPATITDFIEAWNKTDPMWREPLYEFLGMEKSEFALWVRDPDTLTFIVKARQDQVPLMGIVKDDYQQLRLGGRARNRVKIALRRNWLAEQGQRRWLREQDHPSAPASYGGAQEQGA